MEWEKKSGRSQRQNTEKRIPIKSMTRLNFGAQLIRLGPFISQKNINSRQNKLILPTGIIISVLTPSLWPALWPPLFPISTVRIMSETQPAVVDNGSGWAFSHITSS